MLRMILLLAVMLLGAVPRVAADGFNLGTYTATDNGRWAEFSGHTGGTLHVTISGTSATVETHVSNAVTRPSDSTDGIALGRTASATTIIPVAGPARWVKVKVTACTDCSVTAILEGVKSGGGEAAQREFCICTNPNRISQYAISTSADVEMVAATAGKRVYICYAEVVSAGTVSVRFISGTGSTCGTSTTALNGLNAWTAQTGVGHRVTPPGAWKTAVGHALCLDVNAAVSVTGVLLYQVE